MKILKEILVFIAVSSLLYALLDFIHADPPLFFLVGMLLAMITNLIINNNS